MDFKIIYSFSNENRNKVNKLTNVIYFFNTKLEGIILKKNLVALLLLLTLQCHVLTASEPVSAGNEFYKGYIFSKLEDRFSNIEIEFEIHDDHIIVYKWNGNFIEDELKFYLESISPCTVSFEERTHPDSCICLNPGPLIVDPSFSDASISDSSVNEPFEEPDFLPELNPFFPTILAQPHIIGYSAGYRSYDRIFRLSCLPVSIGDQFSLWQFKSFSCGNLYIGIEACVWAIFEAKPKSLSLINSDYFVAIPLTYIHDRFSARLRIFHESSHLGDEYLLENNIDRKNPSMEAIDLSLAYEFSDNLTVFLGYTRVIRSDEGFKIKPNNIYYGFNYDLDIFKVCICEIQAVPYVSAYFTNFEDNKWALDSSIALGYQWNKSYGHKVRIYLEAHNGFSADGQFSKKRTNYVSIKLLYGY